VLEFCPEGAILHQPVDVDIKVSILSVQRLNQPFYLPWVFMDEKDVVDFHILILKGLAFKSLKGRHSINVLGNSRA
jgi:hypothetical protein